MKALLTVGLSTEQTSYLNDLMEPRGWKVYASPGWTQVFLRLRERAYQAVICEAALPDGDWRDALDELWACTNPPPFIVISCFADAHLWAAVLDAGGYDVLPYPFAAGELIRILDNAPSRRQTPPGQARQRGVLCAED
jgi:DNA-binding NtrC family response regulator